MIAVEGGPLLDALADHKPHTLRDLAQQVQRHGISFDRLLQFVLVMAEDGYLQSAQEDRAISHARGKGAATLLNMILMRKAKMGQGVSYLASPMTGGGVPVERYHQLFLLARSEGLESPDQWAQMTLRWLAAEGERVVPTVLSGLVAKARAMGRKDPQAWAQATLAFLQENSRLPGKPVSHWETSEGELVELTEQARLFGNSHLSMLISLGVV